MIKQEFSQPVVDYNGVENLWQYEMAEFLTEQPKTCLDGSQVVTVESTMMNNEECVFGPTDCLVTNSGLQMMDFYSGSNVL